MRIRHRLDRGFTLIELMVVIVILGLLVTIVAPNFQGILGGAKMDIARSQMANLEKTVDIFRLQKGRLPDTLDELVSAGLMESVPTDPWGGNYQYSRTDKKRYELTCLGADGVEGGTEEEDMDIKREDIHKKKTE
jgi:general secretion pathway protein G